MICLAFPWYPLGNHSLYSSSLNYNTAEHSLLICVQCILKFRNMPQPGKSAPQQEYRSIAGFQLIQFLRALVQMGQYLCPDIFFLQEFLKDLTCSESCLFFKIRHNRNAAGTGQARKLFTYIFSRDLISGLLIPSAETVRPDA